MHSQQPLYVGTPVRLTEATLQGTLAPMRRFMAGRVGVVQQISRDAAGAIEQVLVYWPSRTRSGRDLQRIHRCEELERTPEKACMEDLQGVEGRNNYNPFLACDADAMARRVEALFLHE